MDSIDGLPADTPQSQTSELYAAVIHFLSSWDRLRAVSSTGIYGLEALWHQHEDMGAAWIDHRKADRALHSATRDLTLAPFALRLVASNFLTEWDANSAQGDASIGLQASRRHLREAFSPQVHLYAAASI